MATLSNQQLTSPFLPNSRKRKAFDDTPRSTVSDVRKRVTAFSQQREDEQEEYERLRRRVTELEEVEAENRDLRSQLEDAQDTRQQRDYLASRVEELQELLRVKSNEARASERLLDQASSPLIGHDDDEALIENAQAEYQEKLDHASEERRRLIEKINRVIRENRRLRSEIQQMKENNVSHGGDRTGALLGPTAHAGLVSPDRTQPHEEERQASVDWLHGMDNPTKSWHPHGRFYNHGTRTFADLRPIRRRQRRLE